MNKTLLFTALLAGTLAGAALAQTPGSTGPTPTPQATTVPLDGGAGLLLAGGVAYALRRLPKRRRPAGN